MKAETLAEQLLFATVRLETEHSDGSDSVGTGFFYSRKSGDDEFLMIITNQHVVADAANVTVTLTRASEDGQPLLGETVTTRVDLVGWPLVHHPKPSIDVAAILASPILLQLERAGTPAFFRKVTDEYRLTEEMQSSLDAIEQVTFIGYPNGLFDTSNFLPIVRRGSTATPLGVDYRGEPTFLIDASVFPGSSGSPVFLLDRGFHTDRSNNTVAGTRFALLGVVAAVHVRTLAGKFTEHLTRLGVSVDEPIDLGIVFKASTFPEVADALIAELSAT